METVLFDVMEEVCVWQRTFVKAVARERKTQLTDIEALAHHVYLQSHLLSMSLSNMNNIRCCPKKDYNANRVNSGVLQLTDSMWSFIIS